MTELTVLAHHAGLTVRDLDAAQNWYGAALGFETVMAFDLPGGVRGAMLRTPGGAGVELFEVDGAAEGLAWSDPPAALRRRGFGHVAFEVSDLDAAFAAFVHDPDGNLVELIGPAGA